MSVTIDGVSGAALDNVRAYLGLREESFLEEVAGFFWMKEAPEELTENEVRARFRRAPNEIKQALQAFGYYHAKVRSELTEHEGEFRMHFQVTLGPPVRIMSVDFQIQGAGKDDPPFQKLAREFPLTLGDILNDGIYEEAKAKLQSLALERGYFDGQFTAHRIDVDPDTNEARITLHFDTGSRYRFGPVNFAQDVLDTKFLYRFVPFKLGAPFLGSELLKLQSALVGTNYFSTVQVRRQVDPAFGDWVPVEVVLSPRKKYKLSLKAGLGTDTGPRGILGFDVRRLNRRGHQLFTELGGSLLPRPGGVSTASRGFTARYLIPLEDPLTEKLSFDAQVEDQTTDTFDSTAFRLGATRTDALGAGWVQNLFLRFQQESFDVSAQDDDTRLILPGANWTRVVADDRLDPRRGSRLYLQLQGTDSFLGSQVGFAQARAQAKLIRGFGDRHRILLRTDLGATLVDDFDRLPPSVRFFAGGSDSVRGFTLESLGPEDANGEVIGGRYLAVGSVEYEYRFLEKWSAAVFYDTGNAFNDTDVELASSVGFGVRWRSPVGPIRVDLAFRISGDGETFPLVIRMGPDL